MWNVLFMVSGCPERDVSNRYEKFVLYVVRGIPQGHEILW
jgi:hypothetical protein